MKGAPHGNCLTGLATDKRSSLFVHMVSYEEKSLITLTANEKLEVAKKPNWSDI
jgi:hypothetical protein